MSPCWLLGPAENDGGDRWYFSRKEIEENSPSRRDGIDLKKEAYFRKSYCSFLHELGKKLKVSQVTIATATMFCHRFFLRQSHGKHDRIIIATSCLFLASKVEETPRPLSNVIVGFYEIIHKMDPETVKRIFKQGGVYKEQRELILHGETLVLETLDFDLFVSHPYKPLMEAIRKLELADRSFSLAQVAWNFVNDGLRTSLCLQLKPHQIAAGALFLAAKFLKIKLPSDGQKAWWQEFAVTPSQLEEVSNQMLGLYEQKQNTPPRSSQVKASEAEFRPPSKVLANGESASNGTRQVSSRPIVDTDSRSHIISECKRGGEINDSKQPKQGQSIPRHNTLRIHFHPKCQPEQEKVGGRVENLEQKDLAVSQPPPEAIKNIITVSTDEDEMI